MYHLQYPQFNEFFYEEKLCNPIYQYNDFEDDYKTEEMVHKRQRRFDDPNLIRRDGFSNNSNRRVRFPYPNSIHDKEGGYSESDEFRNPFLWES